MSGETPTLGWIVLAWMGAHLPNPRDETQPYRPVAWQMGRTIRWYELEPSGRRRYDRVHDEDPKGKGKSPHAGATAIAEFRGPVVFDGWARKGDVYACEWYGCSCGWVHAYRPGEAKGKPWGSPGLPSPWIQVAALSEAQTANTWAALHAFLAANKGKLARDLNLEDHRTLVYWRERVDAKIERVTASAGTRTGQPITHAILDEPQEWIKSMGGPTLARTILDNLTKMDGWAHFTGNAPILGRGSVSEIFRDPSPRALFLAPRPSIDPTPDMPREQLRALLEEVYEGTPWAPIDRFLSDREDHAAHPWDEFKRLFLNVPHDARAESRWMPEDLWASCEDDVVFRRDLPVHAAVRVAHEHRLAAIAWAQLQGDVCAVRTRLFRADAAGDGYVAAEDLERALRDLRARYPAKVEGVVRNGKREYPRKLPGPEVAYHGAFFHSTADRLRKSAFSVVDVPDSPARRAQAAEQLMDLVINERLHHDGDPVLAAHMGHVEAVPVAKGWEIVPPTEDRPIVAALAAMTAVLQAVTHRPVDRSMSRGRPR